MIPHKHRNKISVGLIVCALTLIIALGVYATWYSYNRDSKMAESRKCADEALHPPAPVWAPGPDGEPAEIEGVGICIGVIVPPSLWDLIQGNIALEGVPARMKVNAYTTLDVLLGNYSFGPDTRMGCDQSATTTDCSSFPTSPAF